MKKTILVLTLCLSIIRSFAQGTVYFSAHLTGNTQYTGDGTFILTTNFFHYDVFTAYGFFDAQIRSPWPNTNAPGIFALDLIAINAPIGADPGFSRFRGSFTLSNPQIADLLSGNWFVHSFSVGDPTRPLQGQILPIPEPSVMNLCATTLFSLFLCNRNRMRFQKAS